MKKLLLISIMLSLASCASTDSWQPTVTKYKVVMPDRDLYSCPLYRKFPNYKTLTDVQVAKMIRDLYKNNVNCKNAITTLENFLKDAKVVTEEVNTQ